jgi:DNA-binding MarR family transcriptional regulator
MSEEKEEESIKGLARVFQVFSTPGRIKAFKLIKEGKSLEEIAGMIGMSRTGFQRVLDDFESLELIESAGHRSYRKLSSKGEEIFELLEDSRRKLENIEMKASKSKLLSLAERSYGAPALSKLKEALESMEKESKESENNKTNEKEKQ